MSNPKTKSIIGGMTVLGIAGVICKLVGVLYSIPLTWMIGTQGLGVYNAVFPAYNLLLTVSSAGLPVAVSRLVARSLAQDNPRGAKHVFKTALLLLLGVGSIATIIMLAGSGFLAAASDQPTSRIGFQVIAPCVVIVCVLSAFRGFMQGQQNMVPTAISQLIEQVGKVFLALPMAYLGSRIGIEYGAAGALLGTTIVEGVALLYMILLYMRRRNSFAALPQLNASQPESTATIARQLMALSLPITIGACIVPLSQYIDSIMLVGRLMSTGMTAETASSVYGLFSGTVIRIINIPTALALAVSMSLVPAISSAKAVNDSAAVARQTDLGMRFAFLIGLPCSIGMSVLAEPMMRFFYQGSIVEEELILGGELLTMSSLTIILFTVVQATTSVLQGLGKQRIPMYTLVAGVICKIILNYVLIAIPSINIHGAPIASLVCYTVSMVPNLYFMLKYTESRMNWVGWMVRPGIATAAMGVVVWLLRELLPVNRLTLLLEVAAGIVVYAVAALAVKAITKDDLRAFRRKK
ncbi:MAG: polysaccharide biosynthesis C-terminal domain-containing protein [Aristaeellaceae bacterium]